MFHFLRPVRAAGHLAFEYERLLVLRRDKRELLCGSAHLDYDGRGTWWLAQVEVSPRKPGPNKFVPVSDPLWQEIERALVHQRADDIAERIQRKLDAVDHMRLFGECPPLHALRRSEPPFARRVGTRLVRALADVAELACIALLIAGIGLWADAPAPAAGVAASTPPIAVAPVALATVALATREDRR